TQADFRAFLAARQRKGLVNASLARALAGVRAFFRWLADEGLCVHEAVESFQTPKGPRALPRPLGVEAASALGQDPGEVAGPSVGGRDLALMTLVYGTGLRIGEAVGLPAGVLKAGASIIVKGKGGKERLVPLLPIVREALARYAELMPFPLEADQPLF